MSLKLQTNFFTLKQPKHHLKMAALMLLLPTEATAEEKMNACAD